MCLFSCRTILCSNQFITPVFIGFSASDMDTLVIRKYQKNDNFLHLMDTILVVNDPPVADYFMSKDTTFVVPNVLSGEEKYLMPGYDWQIYIPSKKRMVSLSAIISPQKEYRCFGDHCGCINPITSFLQDGQLSVPQIDPIQNYGGGYVTYISNQ